MLPAFVDDPSHQRRSGSSVNPTRQPGGDIEFCRWVVDGGWERGRREQGQASGDYGRTGA